MRAAASSAVPLTLTPVHDAANRWAAMRLNLAAHARPDDEIFGFLYGADGSTPLVADVPLLIETDDPRSIGKTLEPLTPAAAVYLLVSPQQCAAPEAKDVFSQLEARGVFTIAKGLAADHVDSWAHGLVLDCANGVPSDAARVLQRCKGPLMASSIGSRSSHHDCLKAGFQWFEGNWAIQPNKEAGTQSATSRTLLLNLLGLVASDADSHSIEDLLKRDPNLSYQLLKLVNSVGFSLTHKISSFSQAITLLGRRQLQRWVQLLLYAGHHDEGAVNPLLGRAAMRAALMEAVIEETGGKQEAKDHAFMAGMFSLLDVLFNMPLEALVKPLNLDPTLSNALQKRQGLLGQQLDVVVAAEAAPDDALGQMLADINLDPEAFLRAQLRASAWALQVCRDI